MRVRWLTPSRRIVLACAVARTVKGIRWCDCLRFTGSYSSQVSERNIANWADSQARECPIGRRRARIPDPNFCNGSVGCGLINTIAKVEFVVSIGEAVYVTTLQLFHLPWSSAGGLPPKQLLHSCIYCMPQNPSTPRVGTLPSHQQRLQRGLR